MKNKKGFTLIELLAVIVILAIIALIAVPIILNMINSARKSAARSAALGYVDSVEYYSGFNQISSDVELPDYNVPLPAMTDGKVTCTKDSSGWNQECSAFFEAVDKKAKGDKPKTATIVISSNGKVLSGTKMVFNKYEVNYDGKDAIVGDSSSNSNNNNPEPELLNINILNNEKLSKASTDNDNRWGGLSTDDNGNTYYYMWVWETTPTDMYYIDKITVNQGERYKLTGKASVWWNCSTHERLTLGFSNTNDVNEDFTKSQSLVGNFQASKTFIEPATIDSHLQNFEVTIDEPGEYYIKAILVQTNRSCSSYAAIKEFNLEQY